MPGAGAAPSGQEHRGGFALPDEIVAHHLDEARQPLRYRKAVARVADRGFQHAPQRQPAMGIMRRDPARDRARYRQRRRNDPAQRDFAQPSLLQRRQRRAAGRLAAAVEILDLPAAAVMDEPERIAAQPRHVRIDHRQHGARHDRGIDGRSAGAKHVDAGRGSQRMRRRHHAVRRERDRTSGADIHEPLGIMSAAAGPTHHADPAGQLSLCSMHPAPGCRGWRRCDQAADPSPDSRRRSRSA